MGSFDVDRNARRAEDLAKRAAVERADAAHAAIQASGLLAYRSAGFTRGSMNGTSRAKWSIDLPERLGHKVGPVADGQVLLKELHDLVPWGDGTTSGVLNTFGEDIYLQYASFQEEAQRVLMSAPRGRFGEQARVRSELNEHVTRRLATLRGGKPVEFITFRRVTESRYDDIVKTHEAWQVTLTDNLYVDLSTDYGTLEKELPRVVREWRYETGV